MKKYRVVKRIIGGYEIGTIIEADESGMRGWLERGLIEEVKQEKPKSAEKAKQKKVVKNK